MGNKSKISNKDKYDMMETTEVNFIIKKHGAWD